MARRGIISFDELIKEMKDKGIIEELKSKFYIYPQTKYLIDPRIEPDLSILNGREIEHIDWEIARLSDLTASMLSELSHRDVPWISAEGKKREKNGTVLFIFPPLLVTPAVLHLLHIYRCLTPLL